MSRASRAGTYERSLIDADYSDTGIARSSENYSPNIITNTKRDGFTSPRSFAARLQKVHYPEPKCGEARLGKIATNRIPPVTLHVRLADTLRLLACVYPKRRL